MFAMRLYRLLLRAYPRSLRAAHGAEMLAAVEEAWQAARRQGRRARLRFVGRLLADFARSLSAARRATAPPRQSVRHRDLRGRDSLFSRFSRDLRLATRILWRARWSTAAIVITLSLVIGANVAVFSAVQAVLFKPLPYRDPGRLVAIWERNIIRHHDRNVVGAANFMAWQDRARSFSSMAAFGNGRTTLTGGGPPENVSINYSSWNLLDMLGVRPILGRTFRHDDSVEGNPRVVIIASSLWLDRYHGDPALIGRTVILDGVARTVVGVLSRGFRFLGETPQTWVPVRPSPAWREPQGRSLRVFARLKRGVSVAQARAEMDAIAASLEQEWPDFDTGWRTSVVPVREDMAGSARIPMLLLLGAVGIVLLVGCANTANLLLARASERRRELAVRAALGASRGRLVAQLSVEGLLLAAAGTAGGLLAARVGLALLLHYVAGALGIPRLDEASVSVPVLGFTLGLMAVCALAFSLVPALHVGRETVAPAFVTGGRGPTSGRVERRVREALVVAQVALAVLLAVAAGLVGRSLAQLTSVSPGFNQDVFTFTLSLPSARYRDEAVTSFFERALTELRALPGVAGASGVAWLPFNGLGGATSFIVAGRQPPPKGQEPVADIRPVDQDYFAVMGIPLERGRLFTPDEVLHGTHLAVVNEALAHELFPSQNPVGQRLDVSWVGTGSDEIIGVVGDTQVDSLADPVRPMIYFPYGRSPLGFMNIVLGSGEDDRALLTAATAVVHRLDPDLPLTDTHRMRDLIDDSVAPSSVAALLIGAFAVVTLTLALMGVAALLAAVVSARRPEFGVRLALGATRGAVRRLVIGRGLRLVGLGLMLGLAASAFSARLATGLLFDVRPTDPAAYAATAALVAAVALVAADIPARQATRVNPADTLRQ